MKHRKFIKIINIVLIAVFVMAVFNIGKIYYDYRAKSTFKSDIELEYNDTIVTLSTCSYEFDNARYIVIGRLIPV